MPDDFKSEKIINQFRDLTDEHQDHSDVAALHDELSQDAPDRNVVNDLVGRLSGHPELGSKIQMWWNDPRTQAFIAELNATGL